jgi:hypothetical protein
LRTTPSSLGIIQKPDVFLIAFPCAFAPLRPGVEDLKLKGLNAKMPGRQGNSIPVEKEGGKKRQVPGSRSDGN